MDWNGLKGNCQPNTGNVEVMRKAYGRKREMFRIGNCEGGEERLNPRYQPDSGQLWKGFVAFVLIVAMILFATPVVAIPILIRNFNHFS